MTGILKESDRNVLSISYFIKQTRSSNSTSNPVGISSETPVIINITHESSMYQTIVSACTFLYKDLKYSFQVYLSGSDHFILCCQFWDYKIYCRTRKNDTQNLYLLFFPSKNWTTNLNLEQKKIFVIFVCRLWQNHKIMKYTYFSQSVKIGTHRNKWLKLFESTTLTIYHCFMLTYHHIPYQTW